MFVLTSWLQALGTLGHSLSSMLVSRRITTVLSISSRNGHSVISLEKVADPSSSRHSMAAGSAHLVQDPFIFRRTDTVRGRRALWLTPLNTKYCFYEFTSFPLGITSPQRWRSFPRPILTPSLQRRQLPRRARTAQAAWPFGQDQGFLWSWNPAGETSPPWSRPTRPAPAAAGG